MPDGTQGPQGELPPPARPRPTDEENPSPDFPPIAAEDLAKMGVEPRLIPFVVSATLRVEQSTDASSPLTPAEAENLVEILDNVYPHLRIFTPRAKSPTGRSCHPRW